MVPAAWIALCSTRHTGMLDEDKNEEEKNTVQNDIVGHTKHHSDK